MALALLAPKPSSHPFHERQLSLKEPVKIGRAVAKAKSANNNGIFDCKVLSRNHAVIWHENDKFMLQDTKSSNGTYVNSVRLSRGAEESEPCEIKSGDTLQFGVEVVENSKNVTHGCIIGLVTLFNEDGTEATHDQEDSPQGLFNLLTASDQSVLPQELWQLAQFLQDALHREQMLENKLATLQRMIGNCHVASEDTFQGFIQEDKLLSRLETLENQLEIVTKESSEDEIQAGMVTYQDERLQYESSAKETLQRILTEKIDVLQKCSDLERLLSNSEDEYSYLKSVYDKAQESIQQLMEKNKQASDEILRLQEELANSMKNHENIEEEYAKKVDELKILLEEAERRGSSAAVEVESLQAECDFTKEQLQSMKERYDQLQDSCAADGNMDSDNGDIDRSANDLPFASENATLEKDVKNKSAYIQTLKVQLADVMSELERERGEAKRLREGRTQSVELNLPDMYQLEDLQEKLTMTKNFITSIGETIRKDEPVNLMCTSWNEFVDLTDFKVMSVEEQSDCYDRALSSCNSLMNAINGDLQNLNMVMSWQEPAHPRTVEVNASEDLQISNSEMKMLAHEVILVEPIDSVDENLVVDVRVTQTSPDTEYNEIPPTITSDNLHQYQVADIALDSSQVQDQESLLLPESGITHQTTLVPIETSGFEHEVTPIPSQQLQVVDLQLESNEKIVQDLFEAEVEAQALREENASLKLEMTVLLMEHSNLKEELQIANEEARKMAAEHLLLSRYASESLDAASVSESMTSESVDGNWRVNDLQDQLVLANQVNEDLKYRRQEEKQFQLEKQNQLVNLVTTLFILMVLFGSLVMLGIVKISPGNLPVLQETTWTDIWESLF